MMNLFLRPVRYADCHRTNSAAETHQPRRSSPAAFVRCCPGESRDEVSSCPSQSRTALRAAHRANSRHGWWLEKSTSEPIHRKCHGTKSAGRARPKRLRSAILECRFWRQGQHPLSRKYVPSSTAHLRPRFLNPRTSTSGIAIANAFHNIARGSMPETKDNYIFERSVG